MRNAIIYITVLFLSLNIEPGMAQTATQTNGISLADAISQAKQNNNAVKNAKLDELTAKEEVKGVISTGLPQVDANGSFLQNLDIATQLIPGDFMGQPGTYVPVQFGVDYIGTGSVSARQLIFDGTFFLGLKAARQYEEVSRLATQKTEEDVVVSTSQAYYQVLLVDRNYQLLKESHTNTNKLYQETDAMYKEGLVEKMDVDRMKLASDKLKVMLQDLSNQKTVVRQIFNMQLGRPIKSEVVLSDNIETVKSQLTGTQKLGGVDDLIDYIMLKQQIILDSLNIIRYKVGRMPKVDFNFSHSQQTQVNDLGDFGDTWYPSTMYSVNIKVPIFDGFKRRTDITKAKIAKEKSENNLRELVSGLELKQYNTSSTYTNSLQKLKTSEDNMNLAKDIYGVASIKYKEGVGSSLELTTAQNDLNQAQVDYLNAVYESLVAELEMKKSFGLL